MIYCDRSTVGAVSIPVSPIYITFRYVDSQLIQILQITTFQMMYHSADSTINIGGHSHFISFTISLVLLREFICRYWRSFTLHDKHFSCHAPQIQVLKTAVFHTFNLLHCMRQLSYLTLQIQLLTLVVDHH